MPRDTIEAAAEAGAEFITGLGEWRAGSGKFDTGWQPTKEAAAAAFLTIRKPPAPSIAVYRSELTPEGEQLVIPGCERDAPQAGRKQLDLF